MSSARSPSPGPASTICGSPPGGPPAWVPHQVDVCSTCRAAAEKGIAVADPLVLDSGSGRMQAYWMLDVKPWARLGYGVASRELIDAWNSPRI